jgi:hypothetical protein
MFVGTLLRGIPDPKCCQGVTAGPDLIWADRRNSESFMERVIYDFGICNRRSDERRYCAPERTLSID